VTELTLSYYPGCSLEGTAKEYDVSARAVCGALGVSLEELPDWSCCGASSARRTSEGLAVALPARNLDIAAGLGRDLLIPCAACYNRMKAAQAARGTEDALAVVNLPELLARPELIGRLRERIVRPLAELPVVPYYGCLLTRPAKVTGSPTPFNPTTMDDVLFAAGANVKRWSDKTTCCGASFTLAETGIVRRLCTELGNAAAEAGARAFAVACPMCMANLDTRQQVDPAVPVLYLTELLALAMGLADVQSCWAGHRIDPRPLLREYGLIE